MVNESNIDLSIEDGIAVVTLNRPDKRNALNDAMRDTLADVLESTVEDRSVRAVILTGAGAAFCAGGDIAAMQERAKAAPGDVAFNGWSRQQRTHKTILRVHTLPKPVVAAVNGPATGLGADLALACDFVLASAQATFAWNYLRRGLIPDGGGLYFLPRRVGMSEAKRLLYSGRTIDASEALRLGIAEEVIAPDELLGKAKEFVRDFVRQSPKALALTKSILDQSFELTPDAAFALGSQAQAICYTTTEHQESIAAFLNKSPRKS